MAKSSHYLYVDINPDRKPAPRTGPALYVEAFRLIVNLMLSNPAAVRIITLAVADAAIKRGKHDEFFKAACDSRVLAPGGYHLDDPAEESRFTDEVARLKGLK